MTFGTELTHNIGMKFNKHLKTTICLLTLITSPLAMTKIIDNLDNQRVQWIPFSDQVMGGVSEVNFLEKEEEGLSYYHMEGKVSTENNGGFIQFRAEVGIEDNSYEGLKIKTRGNGEEYYLFIRTTKTRLPWLYYGSSFIASEEWKWIEIPFSSFEKSDGRFSRFLPEEFDIETIKSIGVVAYGKDFYANIDVAGIELY